MKPSNAIHLARAVVASLLLSAGLIVFEGLRLKTFSSFGLDALGSFAIFDSTFAMVTALLALPLVACVVPIVVSGGWRDRCLAGVTLLIPVLILSVILRLSSRVSPAPWEMERVNESHRVEW